jgi:Amidohydrolase family
VLIVNAEIDGRPGRAVRIAGDRVVAVGAAPGRAGADLGAGPGSRGAGPGSGGGGPGPSGEVLDARGGMLIPGLHDHHIHLLALAAAAGSAACGPPAIRDAAALASALGVAAQRVRTAPAAPRWVRGVGYDESVAGRLTRAELDRIVPDVPVRVQHRSGALWIVNSAARSALGPAPPGLSPAAWADGHLFRLDAWLRDRLGPEPPPALDTVGAALAGYGVTGLTDATATTDRAAGDPLGGTSNQGGPPPTGVTCRNGCCSPAARTWPRRRPPASGSVR